MRLTGYLVVCHQAEIISKPAGPPTAW